VDTNAAGTVRGTQTVTVAAAPAATGSLSRTGFDPTGLLVGGGLLLLAGAGAVVVAKRRKSSQAAA
jgi:LPXTG-motif cell wall-anchored protein